MLFVFHVCPQLTDRRSSYQDVDWSSNKGAGVHLKVKTMPNFSKFSDLPKSPEIPHRRTSVDACLPSRHLTPSPSRHLQPMPLPLPPQSGSKALGKKPGMGGEGIMRANLMKELNTVLTKTGRKSNE